MRIHQHLLYTIHIPKIELIAIDWIVFWAFFVDFWGWEPRLHYIANLVIFRIWVFEQILCMTSHCVGHRLSGTLATLPYIVLLYTLNVVNFTYLCCLNNFPSHRCLWQVINSILLTSLLLPTKELASGFCFREDEVLNQNELHQSLHCSLWISSVSFGFSP